MSADFLLTSIVVALAPGAGVLFTLAISLGRGRRDGLIAAAGCTLGILPHIAAAALGLAAILHASAVLFTAVKIAGVVFLLYLAWGALREDGPLALEGDQRPRSVFSLICDGVALNLLNPKLSVFFLAFLPQFLTSDDLGAAATLKIAALGLVFMAVTFVVFAGYAMFAAAARDYVLRRPRAIAWVRRSVAAAFGFFAIRLALAER